MGDVEILHFPLGRQTDALMSHMVARLSSSSAGETFVR